LGDLARYHRDLYRDPAKNQWTQAASFYTRALRLWPENGHPYNQLAVLCSYNEDEFRTFYYYIRSLAVKLPFGTAKENVLGLLERNRKQQSKNQSRAPAEKVNLFLSKIVRLHGILFTKTSLEECKKMREPIFSELDNLMQEGAIKESIVLKILLINIFAMYNSRKPESDSDDIASQYAISLAMDCFSRVLQHSKLAASSRKSKNVTFSDEYGIDKEHNRSSHKEKKSQE
jgi:protein SMG7